MVAQNKETLQMIIGMKILEDLQQFGKINRTQRNEYMLVLSNRIQKIVNNDFNFDEINFRILKANVNDLIRNTRCANNDIQNNNKNNN